MSTKLNLMKLKANSSTHPTHQNANHHPSQTSTTSSHHTQLPSSSSVPIFAFKNTASDTESALLVSNLESRVHTSPSTSSGVIDQTSLSSSPTTSDVIETNKSKRSDSVNSGGGGAPVRRRKRTLAAYDSAEEDSPESSGDEYVHSGFMDEENKFFEAYYTSYIYISSCWLTFVTIYELNWGWKSESKQKVAWHRGQNSLVQRLSKSDRE